MNKISGRPKSAVPVTDAKRQQRESIKKSSYYVWFLGAKECRGLSGDEYVHPAVRHLVEKENSVEPLKVTLQVSAKGMKIIHNNALTVGVKNSGSKSSSKAEEQPMKHFVPDNNICYVTQEAPPNDDIVACIVMIPITRYPLHVHVYRCDSVGTANVLRHHLQLLVDRPENQKKMAELEQQQRRQQQPKQRPTTNLVIDKNPLPPQALHHHPRSSLPSTPASVDERNSETSSGGGGSSSGDREIVTLDEKISGLYVSLTAELREKLENRKNDGPLLLPPKDYDMTLRRLREASKRPTIITTTSPTSRSNGRDSSGKSSGIGSDEAPSSPTHERGNPNLASSPVTAQPSLNRHHADYSSDDDEQWNTEEERLIATVKKPTFSSSRDVSKQLISPQPLVVNMDPSNEPSHNMKMSKSRDSNIWPPPAGNQRGRGGRVPLSPSRSCDDQPPLSLRNDDSRVRRNESLNNAHYHELPDEKRYPGLDRETAARLPFNPSTSDGGTKKAVTPTTPLRDYDWDRPVGYYMPSQRSHADEPSYVQQQRYQLPAQHPSMKRSSQPPTGNGIDDERRFFRYSSPDMEQSPNYRY